MNSLDTNLDPAPIGIGEAETLLDRGASLEVLNYSICADGFMHVLRLENRDYSFFTPCAIPNPMDIRSARWNIQPGA